LPLNGGRRDDQFATAEIEITTSGVVGKAGRLRPLCGWRLPTDAAASADPHTR
jgi:hypothetical protein